MLAVGTAGAAGTIHVNAPKMDDGELAIGSWGLPEQYKCDACRAAAYQVGQAFTQLAPGAAEQDVFDALDEACSAEKGMSHYGVKARDGDANAKMLSGPGTPGAAVAGAQFADSNWAGRMARFCEAIVGDSGEEGLFKEATLGKNLTETMCTQHTRHCRHKPRAEKRAKAKANPKAKAKAAEQEPEAAAKKRVRREADAIRKLTAAQDKAKTGGDGSFGQGTGELSRVDKLEMALARVEATQKAMKQALCKLDGAKTSRLCTHGVDVVQNLNIRMEPGGTASVTEEREL